MASHKDSSRNSLFQHLHLWLDNSLLQKVCTGNLAIMQADGDLQAVEGVLKKDMTTTGKYSRRGR